MMEYFSEGNGLVIWASFLLLASTATITGFKLSKKNAFTGQAIIPTVMIAFSLLLWAVTFSFPSEEAGPALIPRLWIFWAILLSCAILLFCFTETGDKDPKSGRLGFLAIGVALTVAYYFAINVLGYFISSFVFLAVLMYMLSYRKPLTIIIVCSGWVIFSYLVFYKLLYIQLPLGFIENYI
ncbi:MAG: tripartite tricarboxylate transporter TctB family protein [Desulforhopalus sp.]